MTRQDAIRAIRARLLELVDDEHSMCRVAAERGIYCQGFSRLTDEDLRRRYQWMLRRNPSMSRQDLENLADRWQLARQIVDKVPISCDAQSLEHDTCDGWETFDDQTLVQYYKELVGGDIVIEG